MTVESKVSATDPAASVRRLSPWRVVMALIIVVALVAVGLVAMQWWVRSNADGVTAKPWFAAYVDVTATPLFDFAAPAGAKDRDVALSFIVADPTDRCTPSWGGSYTMKQAADQLDLDRRVARLQQQGGGISVSFGGLLNDELATSCTDVDALESAYASVVDRYQLDTIDLDIEAGNLQDEQAGARRAKAIASLQGHLRSNGKQLAVWLTLPVATSGLTEVGTTTISQMLNAGVDLAGVNAMIMNFGQSRDKGESMLDASIRALRETQRQLGVLYTRSGTHLSDSSLWHKIGATPMIGQNDDPDEVFTMADAKGLNAFVRETGIIRTSMWSLNRDITCGPNYANLKRVSDSCSGVDQKDAHFADVLRDGLTGTATLASNRVTTPDPVSEEDLKDDPATSPYQVWSTDASYLQETKVVWHHNVYKAKWWTRGDVPDNPVLNTWETPWLLIGPVLPGETPIPMPTLSPGTYPDWSGETIYQKGDRVLFDETPYESKWWNTAESPDAASSSPDSSPWVPLTLKQIEAVEGGSAAPDQHTGE